MFFKTETKSLTNLATDGWRVINKTDKIMVYLSGQARNGAYMLPMADRGIRKFLKNNPIKGIEVHGGCVCFPSKECSKEKKRAEKAFSSLVEKYRKTILDPQSKIFTNPEWVVEYDGVLVDYFKRYKLPNSFSLKEKLAFVLEEDYYKSQCLDSFIRIERNQEVNFDNKLFSFLSEKGLVITIKTEIESSTEDEYGNTYPHKARIELDGRGWFGVIVVDDEHLTENTL